MPPTLRELIEDPERVRALPPEAIPAVLGQAVVFLSQLFMQISATYVRTEAQRPENSDRLLTVRETATLFRVRPALAS
jgi:hypothetical protein